MKTEASGRPEAKGDFGTSPPEHRNGEKKLTPPKLARVRKHLTIGLLLKPHTRALVLGFFAVVGETAANLLQPWPLKIVLDDVLQSKRAHGTLFRHVESIVGTDKMAIIEFACVAVLAIALLDAVCSYFEKYLTTNVGQWVSYDLRRMLYAHIQRLSLAFHDQKRTGDLISRVTSDVDDIQSFITSSLLSTFINALTLVGMVAVMFWLNWQFTLIALSVAPVLFLIVFTFTRRIKNASRAV